MTRPLRDSTDAELEAFTTVCDRLGGFDSRIGAEWADGYLTALAAGLRMPAFDEWVARMAGDAFERAFADPEDRANAERALGARAFVLREQLDAESLDEQPDQLRLSPLMVAWTDEDRAETAKEHQLTPEQANELVTGADWADGFFAALADFAAEWPEQVSDEAKELFESLAQQVHALRLPEGSDELRQHVAATYRGEAADRDRLVDEACFAVQDLRLWAVDNAPRPETRRVDKAPGRNDPCPCGSGKKFKKCHGAAA
jgi:uncharacterized protein